MNKFFIFIVMILVANFSHAQLSNNPGIITQFELERLASEVNQLTYSNARDLNQFERRSVFNQLMKAREILLFSNSQMNQCSLEDPNNMKNAFLKIKSVAMALSGFAMTSEQAVEFAQGWIEKYPCSEAQNYTLLVKKIRLFTAAETGMGMNQEESIEYTKLIASKFCGDNLFTNDYRNWFSIASSATGMNFPKSKAREFAKQKMEQMHFSCQVLK